MQYVELVQVWQPFWHRSHVCIILFLKYPSGQFCTHVFVVFNAKYPGVHWKDEPHYLFGFAYVITGKVGQLYTHIPAYK